jgi:hypothetical protein
VDLVWRSQSGPPRPAFEAVIAAARRVRAEAE